MIPGVRFRCILDDAADRETTIKTTLLAATKGHLQQFYPSTHQACIQPRRSHCDCKCTVWIGINYSAAVFAAPTAALSELLLLLGEYDNC